MKYKSFLFLLCRFVWYGTQIYYVCQLKLVFWCLLNKTKAILRKYIVNVHFLPFCTRIFADPCILFMCNFCTSNFMVICFLNECFCAVNAFLNTCFVYVLYVLCTSIVHMTICLPSFCISIFVCKRLPSLLLVSSSTSVSNSSDR